MHDNAPSHAAKATTKFLEKIGFKDETLMVWPPNSPDLNPIENLWAIIKQRVYADGSSFPHYTSYGKLFKKNLLVYHHQL
jgi:transposase